MLGNIFNLLVIIDGGKYIIIIIIIIEHAHMNMYHSIFVRFLAISDNFPYLILG